MALVLTGISEGSLQAGCRELWRAAVYAQCRPACVEASLAKSTERGFKVQKLPWEPVARMPLQAPPPKQRGKRADSRLGEIN
jgi:hypothetical protein